MEKQVYEIGVCCSEADGVKLYRVRGTGDEVKKYLYNLVKEDRRKDPDSFDGGMESPDEVEELDNGELYAYANYSDYHIDYTAIPEPDITQLDQNGNAIDQNDINIADEEWLKSLEKKGLTISVSKAEPSMLAYTLYHWGSPVANGKVSDEGLAPTALKVKLMRLINAEDILDMLEPENVEEY